MTRKQKPLSKLIAGKPLAFWDKLAVEGPRLKPAIDERLLIQKLPSDQLRLLVERLRSLKNHDHNSLVAFDFSQLHPEDIVVIIQACFSSTNGHIKLEAIKQLSLLPLEYQTSNLWTTAAKVIREIFRRGSFEPLNYICFFPISEQADLLLFVLPRYNSASNSHSLALEKIAALPMEYLTAERKRSASRIMGREIADAEQTYTLLSVAMDHLRHLLLNGSSKESVKALEVSMLFDPKTKIELFRYIFISNLDSCGEPTLRSLCSCNIQLEAFKRLITFHVEEQAEILQAAILSSHSEVRKRALGHITRLPKPQQLFLIKSALTSRYDDVQIEVLFLFHSIDSKAPVTVSTIYTILKGIDPKAQFRVLNMLFACPEECQIPLFKCALSSFHIDVQLATLNMVAALPREMKQELLVFAKSSQFEAIRKKAELLLEGF